MTQEQTIAAKLIAQQKTLAAAESCTGGLVASRLTDVPGSSGFFKTGIVAYSNAAKTGLLKITPSLIKKHGAVSFEVAMAMAQNIRKICRTDFGIGITGIAGPTGGSKTKPVGLTYIAVASKADTLCLKCHFKGTRVSIKKQAAAMTLKTLLEFLLD